MKLKVFGKTRPAREENENPKSAAAVKKTAGRQLIVSSCLTFVCVLVLAAATVAWFANNREVDSNGMEIQVETSPNLVISDNIQTLAAMTSADAAFSAEFSSAAETLIPATHDFGPFAVSSESNNGMSSTGLKYNRNPSVISPTSGYAKDDTHTLYYNEALNDSTRVYYKDYTVFIASINKPLPADGLVAALSSLDTDGCDYQDAASVDFYVDVMSDNDYENMVSASASDYTTMAADYVDDVCVDTNYIGTLNLAEKGFTDTLSDLSSLDLAGGSTTVPLNTAGCITVVMRFYFDGALEKDTDQAYVYSNNLSTADFTMKVTFTATGE